MAKLVSTEELDLVWRYMTEHGAVMLLLAIVLALSSHFLKTRADDDDEE